eukprot:1167268-Amorphochlora_amoeboformis.AAC.1
MYVPTGDIDVDHIEEKVRSSCMSAYLGMYTPYSVVSEPKFFSSMAAFAAESFSSWSSSDTDVHAL